MTDDQGVNNTAGEPSEPTPPVDEPKASGEPEVLSEPTEPTGEESHEKPKGETEEGSKKGANARIRELNAKAKSAEERAKGLEAKIAELTNPVGFQGNIPQYNPQEPVIRPGEEIDANELNRRLMEREQRILATARSSNEISIRQLESVNRIRTETSQVLKQYPQLDPDSDLYDKDLSEAVTEATLGHVQTNPYTASPKKFVERMMKPYKRAVTTEVGKASENIARQVSQAALRPTSVSTGGKKSDKDKTISELEAELGIVQT